MLFRSPLFTTSPAIHPHILPNFVCLNSPTTLSQFGVTGRQTSAPRCLTRDSRSMCACFQKTLLGSHPMGRETRGIQAPPSWEIPEMCETRRLSAAIIVSHCGCRQVVRPQLPKLVSAGSNPVTRSSALHGRRSQICCGAFLRPMTP